MTAIQENLLKEKMDKLELMLDAISQVCEKNNLIVPFSEFLISINREELTAYEAAMIRDISKVCDEDTVRMLLEHWTKNFKH